jgi:hypothetical protein
MNNRLNAETIRKSKSKLKKRFSEAYSVMSREARALFDLKRADLFDFNNARFLSIDGKYVLQFVNDGNTNCGSVQVKKVK